MHSNFLNLHPLLISNFSSAQIQSPILQFPFNLSYSQPNHCPFVYPQFRLNNVNESQTYNPHYSSINNSISLYENTPFSSDKIKEEDSLKLEPEDFQRNLKQEIFEKKEECSDFAYISYSKSEYETYKVQIKRMLIYILSNLGRVKESDLDREKAAYADDPILLKLFDTLLERYSYTYKTKDEILKYITRKAFATIRNTYKQKSMSKGGITSETLCKRYFKASTEEIEKLGININHRENFLQVLFPYRKNCKNKARYKDLIGKLGASKEFYEDYCSFLTNFKNIMENEKERKVNVFVPFLCDCVKRREVKDVAQYKRIPWLDTWIRLAEITAQEISVALKVRVSNDRPQKKKKVFEKEKNMSDLSNKELLSLNQASSSPNHQIK